LDSIDFGTKVPKWLSHSISTDSYVFDEYFSNGVWFWLSDKLKVRVYDLESQSEIQVFDLGAYRRSIGEIFSYGSKFFSLENKYFVAIGENLLELNLDSGKAVLLASNARYPRLAKAINQKLLFPNAYRSEPKPQDGIIHEGPKSYIPVDTTAKYDGDKYIYYSPLKKKLVVLDSQFATIGSMNVNLESSAWRDTFTTIVDYLNDNRYELSYHPESDVYLFLDRAGSVRVFGINEL